MTRPNLINAKTVFISTIIVVPSLTWIIYLGGIDRHRTIYLNSLLSTTVISILFFAFITIGLYRGWKLKDTLGDFRNKFSLWKKPASPGLEFSGFDFHMGHMDGAGLEGCIAGLLVWIVIGLFGSIILWWLGAVIWVTILVVAGILYWIVFRAFRLIFRNSTKCRGNFIKSVSTALRFTFLYNCWIYAIIWGVHYSHKWKNLCILLVAKMQPGECDYLFRFRLFINRCTG